MLVVGNEPNDSPERQLGAIGGKGFEGEAQPPLASSRQPQCTHIGSAG